MSGYGEGFLNTGLLFCLDYDETYTEDPILFDGFIQLLKSRGHSVIVATMRYEYEGQEIIDKLGKEVDKIIFTGRKAKMKFVHEMGWYPSIWIDDSPNWIMSDAQ